MGLLAQSIPSWMALGKGLYRSAPNTCNVNAHPAVNEVAVIAHTPEIDICRWQTSLCRALARIWRPRTDARLPRCQANSRSSRTSSIPGPRNTTSFRSTTRR
jgi:hypothetical protein